MTQILVPSVFVYGRAGAAFKGQMPKKIVVLNENGIREGAGVGGA